MKTNFDVVTENPTVLARFMHELDLELTRNNSICRFCNQYELLDSPVCYENCVDGFKKWLEKEVKEWYLYIGMKINYGLG